MIARTAKNKHKKDLARRRKLADKARHQAGRAYGRDYPDVAFHQGDAPDGFVRLVKEAVAEVRMDDRSLFTKEESKEFETLKRQGVPPSPGLMIGYGERVFGAIPDGRLQAYAPFCDVMFGWQGRSLAARFRALRQHKGPGGTAYYSRHEPTLDVCGRRYVVAFSGHAVQRACERAVANWRTYCGLGDAYGLIEQTQEYEPCWMPDGRIGFSFFENCSFLTSGGGRLVLRSGAMAFGVLGNDLARGRRYAYRVGYCPCVVEGRYLKAKTLLAPGQRGTPEYELILRHERDPAERGRKREEAELLDAARVRDTLDFGLLRWFHGHGIPQVVEREVRYADPFAAKSG